METLEQMFIEMCHLGQEDIPDIEDVVVYCHALERQRVEYIQLYDAFYQMVKDEVILNQCMEEYLKQGTLSSFRKVVQSYE